MLSRVDTIQRKKYDDGRTKTYHFVDRAASSDALNAPQDSKQYSADRGYRFKNLPKIVPIFFGIFFITAFEALLTIDVYPTDGPEIVMAGSISRYAISVIACTVIALMSRIIFSLSGRTYLAVASVLCCTLGGIVLLACKFFLFSEIGFMGGSLLVGAGASFLKLFWLEFYAKLDMIRVILHYSMAQIISSFVIAGFSLIDPKWLVIGLYLTFPCLSYLCYRQSLRVYHESVSIQGEKISSNWSFPIKPVLPYGIVYVYQSSGALLSSGRCTWVCCIGRLARSHPYISVYVFPLRFI